MLVNFLIKANFGNQLWAETFREEILMLGGDRCEDDRGRNEMNRDFFVKFFQKNDFGNEKMAGETQSENNRNARTRNWLPTFDFE